MTGSPRALGAGGVPRVGVPVSPPLITVSRWAQGRRPAPLPLAAPCPHARCPRIRPRGIRPPAGNWPPPLLPPVLPSPSHDPARSLASLCAPSGFTWGTATSTACITSSGSVGTVGGGGGSRGGMWGHGGMWGRGGVWVAMCMWGACGEGVGEGTLEGDMGTGRGYRGGYDITSTCLKPRRHV